MQRRYEPIPCDQYSRYELAILRRRSLRVCWLGRRGQTHIGTLRPLDLRTRSGAEYMIARDRGNALRVLRLDRIRRAQVLA